MSRSAAWSRTRWRGGMGTRCICGRSPNCTAPNTASEPASPVAPRLPIAGCPGVAGELQRPDDRSPGQGEKRWRCPLNNNRRSGWFWAWWPSGWPPQGHLGTRDAGPVRRARAGRERGPIRAGWTADAGIRAVTRRTNTAPTPPANGAVARCRHRRTPIARGRYGARRAAPAANRRATGPATSAPPRAAPPDETDRLTAAFARAMHNQAQDPMAYRERVRATADTGW